MIAENEIAKSESPENNQEGNVLDAEDLESRKTVSSIADKIKNYIDLHPGLINELGNRLNIDTITAILNCAVTRLKNQYEKR